jgi:hypothetical protein
MGWFDSDRSFEISPNLGELEERMKLMILEPIDRLLELEEIAYPSDE